MDLKKLDQPSTKPKILVVFDFDNTIINGNTGTAPVKKFLSERELLGFRKMMKENVDFIELFKMSVKRFMELGITVSQIKEVIESLKLNDGFSDLFDYFKQNRDIFELIIITGTIDVFVNWILVKNNIETLFTEIFSQKGEVSEQTLINISGSAHSCSDCNTSQCKNAILKEFLDKSQATYNHICYIGDGENDACPAKLLRNEDLLFPRETWGLHKLLEKNQGFKESLNSRVVYWKNGGLIKEEIEKLLNINFQSKF